MVPSFFMRLNTFPVNTSGKINKNELPRIETLGLEDSYNPPTNELEEKLCQIWQEILAVKKIGIDDDFFKIGGNSISQINLINRLSQIGFNVRLKDIQKYKTIRSFAFELRKDKTFTVNEEKKYNIVLKKQLIPLSPIQQRYFIRDKLIINLLTVSKLIKINNDFTYSNMLSLVEKLKMNHFIFSSYFKAVDNDIFLFFDPQSSVIKTKEFYYKNKDKLCNNFPKLANFFKNKINAFTGPLYFFIFIRCAEGDRYITSVMDKK